jgi:trigger factor
MQVSVDKISDLERKMTVQVPAEDVDGQVEERLKSMVPRTKVHGFRPGKVPMRVVRQMYGKQVREEVLGELIQSSFIETVQKEELRPAGGPQVERSQDAPGQPFEYSATFEVYPDVELKPLDELEVKRVSADITDADVDRVVDNMRRQRTRWESVERPAEEGDRVTLSFKGTIDDESFPGGSADDYPLVLGSGQMIPGFEDGLIGTTAGAWPARRRSSRLISRASPTRCCPTSTRRSSPRSALPKAARRRSSTRSSRTWRASWRRRRVAGSRATCSIAWSRPTRCRYRGRWSSRRSTA